LVPLDGSQNSLRGLQFGLILAKQSGASIIGVNVFLLPAFLKTMQNLTHKKEKSKEIINEAELISKKAKVSFKGITKVSTNIGKTIVTIAKSQKVDLIIIGSRGPDPELEMFLGSVANYVVNKSKIPVTVVK
jgi:nucleotide-binding universal stress UspA family protein